jgi:hypothetical protein
VQVGPRRWNQGPRAIGQHQEQVQTAVPMEPPQHFERLAFEGMLRSDDGHAFRIAVEVVVMGSVSCLPSITSTSSG